MLPVVDHYRENLLFVDTSRTLGHQLTVIFFIAVFAFLFYRFTKKRKNTTDIF